MLSLENYNIFELYYIDKLKFIYTFINNVILENRVQFLNNRNFSI